MTTIGQWLTEVGDLPRLECELLLAELAGLSRASVIAFPEREISRQTYRFLNQAAAKLRQGTPLAYILGCREFWGLEFKVSPAVLVPRPESELLVELAVGLAPHAAEVLDLGTGSGAVGISIAHTRRDIEVSATDTSPDALQVARCNARRHRVDMRFIQSDWFSNLKGRWQVIVSNPPYVAAGDVHLEALSAEPRLALVSGDDGLDSIRHLVQHSGEYLYPGGQLILEHGYDQAPAVRALMAAAGFRAIRSMKDLAHIERATLGCMA